MAILHFRPLNASVLLGAGDVLPYMCPSINFGGDILPSDTHAFWLASGEDLWTLRGCSVNLRPSSSRVDADTPEQEIGTAFYSRNDENSEQATARVQFVAFVPDDTFWQSADWIQSGRLPSFIRIDLAVDWKGQEPHWDNLSRNPAPVVGIVFEFLVPEAPPDDSQ